MKLEIPFLSQWGTGANESRNDCGPAALAMLLAGYGISRTVDEVFRATGAPANSYISFDQLIFAAKKFGLNLQHHILSFNELKSKLEQGFPMVALVNYRYFPNKQDKFKGPHFVTVFGLTDDGIICHDPNRLQGNTYGDSVLLSNTDFSKMWEQTNLEHGNKNNQILIADRPLKGGEVEVNRRDTIVSIYESIYHRAPTKQELDRWDESQKSTSETVAELWSSLGLENKISSLTIQVSKMEIALGERQQSIDTKLGSLADGIGQLTSQIEAERAVLSDASLKTDKVQETAVQLIADGSERLKQLQGLGERLSAIEQARIEEQVKEVSRCENPDTEQAQKQEIPSILVSIVAFIRRILRRRP